MGGDDKPDFLREEEENDPAKIQREYMEFAKEYMNEMKKARERRDEELAAETAPGESFLTAPVGLRQWRPRLMITFTIQQIENGFVVLRAHDHGAPPVTEYAPDPDGVKAIVDRETEAFLGTCRPAPTIQGLPPGVKAFLRPPQTPPPEAGKGLPEGPSSGAASVPWTSPKKAGKDPSSAGMTRVEGPPPVSGPLEAPEGPLGPLEP